ncbi:hypothetical protein RFI_14367, partial [Reticulomyxa filosa]
ALAIGDEMIPLHNDDDDSCSLKSVFISNIDVQFIHSNQTPLLPKVFAVYVASSNENMFANGVLVHNGSPTSSTNTNARMNVESVIIKIFFDPLNNNKKFLCKKKKTKQNENYQTVRKAQATHYRYPVRVTLQYYKATSNGVMTDQVMAEIKAQIDNSQKQADFIGSLVTDGLTQRPTDWVAKHVQKIASSLFFFFFKKKNLMKQIELEFLRKKKIDNDKHVKQALANLGLFDTYYENFKSNAVDDKALLALTDSDLNILLPKIGDRAKFRQWLDEYKTMCKLFDEEEPDTDFGVNDNIFF